jgi:signal transduction histidine kinase
MLGHVTRRPTWSRPFSIGIITAMILTIGLTDYLLGVKISLRVFYFVPIALAVGWLGFPTAVAMSVVSVGVWLVGDYLDGSPLVREPETIWNASIVLSMYLVVAWIFDALITLHRQLEERVRERTRALEREAFARGRLQHDLLRISDRERSSIGHDLHDGLCQHLVGTAMAAQVLVEHLAGRDAAAAESGRGIVRLVEEGIAQTRHVARGLLLANIAPDRLPVELDELAATTSRQSGTPCRFSVQGRPHAPDQDTASHLFRIAQEAVRNAVRHGRPKRLDILLEGDDQAISLTVSDDGRGLPAGRGGPGMGLRIMAQRAQLMRADFAVEASPGGGTRVRCRIPLRPAVG